MGKIVELVRPLLFSLMSSCHTKKLVCDLIDQYANTTDNDIDNVIAKMVRDALMKECK
jgi:hypothetical protein